MEISIILGRISDKKLKVINMKFNKTLILLQEIFISIFLSNYPEKKLCDSQEDLYLFITYFHAVFRLSHIFQFALLANENVKPQNMT
jgi:hypothetical protein